MGELNDFEKSNGNLTCPKCSTIFKKNSDAYDVIGISYICDECGYKFDKPNTSHHCQNCGTIYDYTNSIYTLTYTYRVTDKITELVPVREIRKYLRALEGVLLEYNYDVTLEGKLKGKSGDEKSLSIIAEKPDERIIIDISPWGKADNIINMLGKKMDLEPKAAIVVDLSEEHLLQPLEDIYKVKVITGKDPSYLDKFTEYIESLSEPVEEKKGLLNSLLKNKKPENDEEPTQSDEIKDKEPK